MDFDKYENKYPYFSYEAERQYKEKLIEEINNTVASGKEIQEMLANVPNKVKELRKKEEAKYANEGNRLYLLFREDALEEAGLTYLPEDFQGRLFDKAWEDGHSYGYSEVFNYLLGLADLMDGYNVTKI